MSKIKEYKTVKECLEDGHTWSECVGCEGIDNNGNIIVEIKNKCPLPMKRAIKEKLIQGNHRTIYRDELPELPKEEAPAPGKETQPTGPGKEERPPAPPKEETQQQKTPAQKPEQTEPGKKETKKEAA